jgi:hypothetical protein
MAKWINTQIIKRSPQLLTSDVLQRRYGLLFVVTSQISATELSYALSFHPKFRSRNSFASPENLSVIWRFYYFAML